MANNYFIEGNGEVDSLGRAIFKTSERKGDSTFDGTMVTSGTLIIKPNAGYTVAASDFSISNLSTLTTPYLDNGNENPNYKWVESVSITDTGTAGTTSNTVSVLVSLVTSGPRGPLVLSSNFTIGLDIDGQALVDNVDPNVNLSMPIIEQFDTDEITIDADANTNNNATIAYSPAAGITANTTTSGNFKETTFDGQVQSGKATNIGNISVTADAGYYFQETPYFTYLNAAKSPPIITLTSPTITRDSNKRITAYNFNATYKNNTDTATNAKAFLRYKTATIPTVTKEIKKIQFGEAQVSSTGDKKQIVVHGDVDAEFDLVIQDSTGSSILDSRIANKKTLTDKGELDATSKKLISTGRKKGITSHKFIQNFPAYTSIKRETNLNMAGNLSGTKAIFASLTDVQVGDRLWMADILNKTKVTVTALNPDGDNANECTLSSSVTTNNEEKAIFYRPIEYYINIYPKEGTTLGSNIPITKPHYTIKQYDDPLLSFRATKTDSDYTISIGAVVTGSYGKPNAKPTGDLKIKDRAIVYVLVRCDRSSGLFAPVGSTSGIPTWSSTDSTVSSWTNSIPSENGGTHCEIYNIKTTGIGTVSYNLMYYALIKRHGTERVTMTLDLDTIIT